MGKYYSETIKKGSTGESVKEWQRYLNTQGYNLTVDGIFGDNTHNATTQYQTKMGLGVDGIVGKNTWGAAGYSDVNNATSAPTIGAMPTAPTYDSTKFDDTQKGKDALDAYNTALGEVNNYGPFQYVNEEQYKAVMDKILNREDFTYDFNGDALYQQYKDKYIKQGKMAMGDAIGQASAMTGGYGNSYAQSVGQQAYQAQLENLNDIVPELYQMALDRYNSDGQELYNQFNMLGADRERAYGEHKDGYDKLMDALGIARSDYYDGADMFYTEQSNANNVLGQQFNDAMSIWQNETDNAWKQAEWDETLRQNALAESWKQKEYALAQQEASAKYGSSSSGGSSGGSSSGGSNIYGPTKDGTPLASGGGNTGADLSTVPEYVTKNLQNYTTEEGQANYLATLENNLVIDATQTDALLDKYGVVNLTNRTWEVVDDGGINWLGVGIDANAKVRDQFGNTYTLADLRKELKKTMSSSKANDYIKKLQKKLGI